MLPQRADLAQEISALICPANLLDALGQVLSGTRWPICASGRRGRDWAEGRSQDAEWMNCFQQDWSPTGEIVRYTVWLEDSPVLQASELVCRLDDLKGFSDVEVELVIGSNRDAVALAAERDYLTIGISLSPESLIHETANTIAECCGFEIPFRLVGVTDQLLTMSNQIGVINALCSSVLAFSQDIGPSLIAEILLDEDPSHWQFLPEKIQYRSLSVHLDEISEAREFVRGLTTPTVDFVQELEKWH